MLRVKLLFRDCFYGSNGAGCLISKYVFDFTPPANTPEYMSAKSQYLQGSGASITDNPANVPMINELFRFRFLGQMNHSYLRVFPVIVTVAIPTGGDHNGQRN